MYISSSIIFSVPGTHSFTVDSRVKTSAIVVECWGGGGDGGGSIGVGSTGWSSGGGGGGGAYGMVILNNAQEGDVWEIGVASSYSTSAPSAPFSYVKDFFGILFRSYSGSPGDSGFTVGGAGGIGGTVQNGIIAPKVKYKGGNGYTGTTRTGTADVIVSGGGGGAAGPIWDGQDAYLKISGPYGSNVYYGGLSGIPENMLVSPGNYQVNWFTAPSNFGRGSLGYTNWLGNPVLPPDLKRNNPANSPGGGGFGGIRQGGSGAGAPGMVKISYAPYNVVMNVISQMKG